MVKELRENAPAARGREEAGFTQFLAHKSTLRERATKLKKSGCAFDRHVKRPVSYSNEMVFKCRCSVQHAGWLGFRPEGRMVGCVANEHQTAAALVLLPI